jgi:hypothetical protein
MLHVSMGHPCAPPVSRHSGPAPSLFADPLPLPGDRRAFGHPMRPLNVSECLHYWGDVSCAGATLQWPCNAQNPEFGFRCCSK